MKPGYKTTEFWLSLAAMVIGALASSGLIIDGSVWAKIVGVVGSVLGALGYTAARAYAKMGETKAEAMKAVSQGGPLPSSESPKA